MRLCVGSLGFQAARGLRVCREIDFPYFPQENNVDHGPMALRGIWRGMKKDHYKRNGRKPDRTIIRLPKP